MVYIMRSERFIKAASIFKDVKDHGGAVREVCEYTKWKLIESGRIQVTFTIIEMKNAGNVCYILKDSLGMMASHPTKDINELKTFLSEKGFKPIKDWYIQDCGMSEETWREWNSSND